MKIQILHHQELSASLKTAILELCCDAYEEDFTPYLAELGNAMHVLGFEDDELRAHAAWVERELRLGKDRVAMKCAYIEAVAVPIEHQSRGLGSQIMQALPAHLSDFEIAALSPSEPDFYARSGWEMWQGKLAYLKGRKRIATPDEKVMIYRLPHAPTTLSLYQDLETDWRPCDVW
ncbi:GNAT family N-acetyltransferase [Undibacterium danionis]|uniref:GNAT family N-acetyltransferase n=1 Tax=Undibacterium danionis TaxID=1812100 RepID=A0ABV6ID82_9BURK